MAHLVAGLPPFLGFIPLTWASLVGHLLFALVLAWVVRWRERGTRLVRCRPVAAARAADQPCGRLVTEPSPFCAQSRRTPQSGR